MSFLIRWAVLTLSVWAATFVIPGISANSGGSLLVAALVLGVLNSLVRPLLVLISLPVVVLTLGFFIVVINAALLMLTSKLVEGFHVAGFWSAVGGALIVSVVGMMFGMQRKQGPRRIVVTETVYGSSREDPPPGKGRVIDVPSSERRE